MAEYELVCDCQGLAEAQAVRASLAARGIPVHVDGLQANSMFGTIGVVNARVLVPREYLREARELASEVVGELPAVEYDEDEEDDPEFSPMRTPPSEDLVDYPDHEDGEDEEDDEDDEPMPARTRPWMRRTWQGLLIASIASMIFGRAGRGVLLLVLAGVIWWTSEPEQG